MSLRILFIAPQPFFRVRGTPMNVRHVVNALASAGHQVDLLAYPFGDETELHDGVTVLRSPGFPGIKDVKVGPSAAKIPLDGLMFLKAWGLCRKHKYDVIHAVEEAAFFARWLARWYKTRLVYDMDSCISDQLKYSGKLTNAFALRRIEAMERTVIRQADFTLTVCEALSDTVRHLVPDADIVQIEDAPQEDAFVPNPERAAELRAELALPEDAPTILYTGNFESYQGVDLMVQATPALVQALPNARVLLVGGEPDQIDTLRKLAKDLGVAEPIVFAGKRPPADMAAFMTLAHALGSPRTQGTNTALKVYGYMQSGLPIVATNLATHTQVLTPENAWLVEPTPEAFAKGMIAALSDPDEAARRGGAAKTLVDTEYSLPAFRRKVGESYQSRFSPQ